MVSLFVPENGLSYLQASELPVPAFFHDLNLDAYVDKFRENEYFSSVEPYFRYFPEKLAHSEYRQEIALDLSDSDIRSSVNRFISGIGISERYLSYSEKVMSSVQKWKWRLDTIVQYYDSIERFCFELNENPPKSKAFYQLHKELSALLAQPETVKLRAKAQELNASFSKLRFHITINKERATLDFQYSEDDYCSEIRTEFLKSEEQEEQTFTESPFGDMNISPLEEFILNQFIKQDRVLFRDLETFCGIRRDIIFDEIIDLIREFRFYILNLDYFGKMKERSFPVCFPKLVSEKELYMDDCYDIVLGSKNYEQKKEVVFNDVMKASSEKAIIVTGPNQGGKTTLARAFGQSFYFAMMGLPVAANTAKLPFVNRIFTQFASTGGYGVEGRLEHELYGVKNMLDGMTKQSLVIFNELFTSAPTMDALTISRELLKKLIRMDAVCFVVTHTFELAFDSDDYVSLVATVVEDGSFRRTYRIVRKSADGIAYANSIVNKYKLDYSHISYRLGKK